MRRSRAMKVLMKSGSGIIFGMPARVFIAERAHTHAPLGTATAPRPVSARRDSS